MKTKKPYSVSLHKTWDRGSYYTSDNRFTATPIRATLAGRDSSRTRGWLLMDHDEGRQTRHTDLSRVREHIAACYGYPARSTQP